MRWTTSLTPTCKAPATEYLACVVPAFELGRKAGLGLPIEPTDEQKLEPTWASGAQSPAQVSLPVYFHWEFRTGAGGDFEELARLLEPREMPAGVGKRPMDISQPGFQITPPPAPGATLELEGALRVPDAEPTAWPQETRTPFQTALKEILNAPWKAINQEGQEPILAAPIYGRWQAARHTVEMAPKPPDAPPSPPWLHELNLDPRHRAVAARVVQTQQEQLMASAWEQLGEIDRINQLRRQAQLARAVNAVYHAKHFTKFSEETLLKVVASAQSRVVVEAAGPNNVTTRAMLSHRISQSIIPDRAVSAPSRRMTNSRGAISARFQPVGAPPIALVATLNTTNIVQLQRPEAGLVTINEVSTVHGGGLNQIALYERIPTALNTAPPLENFNIVPEGFTPRRTLLDFPPGGADSPVAQAFRNAAKALQDYLEKKAFPSSFAGQGAPMNLPNTKQVLLQNLNPENTVNARARASLNITGGAGQGADPLEPILDAPDFPQPMYEALRDLSQDFLFPGLERVPPNTVALLETNPKFVESFLVGLNAEMSGELLWRDYPTDQRGTYFRRFWGGDQPDIDVIKKWGDSKLGDNARAGEKLVLLIRGELLRRYPNSVIYAVAATLKDGRLDLTPRMNAIRFFAAR